MKMDWNPHLGKMLYVTMQENFGLAVDPKTNSPIFEIVFKSGKLTDVYDDGLLLETSRENQSIKIFIPYNSVKCIEIFNV